MGEKTENKLTLVEEILEKLYKFFHEKVSIRITKFNGETLIVKMFSFTKEAVWGRNKMDNSWAEIDLSEISDVVAY